MSDHPPGTKESRLATALSRVEFWRLWASESVSQGAIDYFQSRERHWQREIQSIEMEP